jgi:hypothetical protein
MSSGGQGRRGGSKRGAHRAKRRGGGGAGTYVPSELGLHSTVPGEQGKGCGCATRDGAHDMERRDRRVIITCYVLHDSHVDIR